MKTFKLAHEFVWAELETAQIGQNIVPTKEEIYEYVEKDIENEIDVTTRRKDVECLYFFTLSKKILEIIKKAHFKPLSTDLWDLYNLIRYYRIETFEELAEFICIQRSHSGVEVEEMLECISEKAKGDGVDFQYTNQKVPHFFVEEVLKDSPVEHPVLRYEND